MKTTSKISALIIAIAVTGMLAFGGATTAQAQSLRAVEGNLHQTRQVSITCNGGCVRHRVRGVGHGEHHGASDRDYPRGAGHQHYSLQPGNLRNHYGGSHRVYHYFLHLWDCLPKAPHTLAASARSIPFGTSPAGPGSSAGSPAVEPTKGQSQATGRM